MHAWSPPPSSQHNATSLLRSNSLTLSLSVCVCVCVRSSVLFARCKMLVDSRVRHLTALKEAFFNSVELKGHLKIFSWQEVQELLED